MGKINLLPDNVVSKIAAGEVVQGPANVVKELIDNSLDADATRIKIYIENAGLKKIKVIDDGIGISKEDLLKAFHPHSTSKLSDISDLESILTLGFRGEALNSIGSVSTATLSSRTFASTSGYKIINFGGEVSSLEHYGMPEGTEVTVENLFYNVPARKKFLKSASIEFSKITQVVSSLAVAYPQVGFDLYHNSKQVLVLPPNQSFEDRVSEVFGDTFMQGLIPVKLSHPHITITGYISRPQDSTRSRNNQHLVINNRPVIEKTIANKIHATYGNLLEAKSQPSFVLLYKFAPELVDVNVHPRKDEVRLISSSLVLELTEEAVLTTLQKHNLTYIKQGFKQANAYILNESSIDNYSAEVSLENILQVHNLYLIQQTSNGIILYDQHAAHERILYEQFLEIFEKGRTASSVELSTSEILNLAPQDFNLMLDYLSVLEELGFKLEEFGKNTFKITHAPELLIDRNLSELILNVLDEITNDTFPKLVDDRTKRALSYFACRSAIKAGDYLTPTQRTNLLKDLASTNTNYTCPHGRPVKVEVSLTDLEKMFKRI